MKYLLMAATGLFSSAATAVTLVAASQDAPQGAPNDYLATVSFTAASYCPYRTLPANGALLPILSYPGLYSLLGNTYGGRPDEFWFAEYPKPPRAFG